MLPSTRVARRATSVWTTLVLVLRVRTVAASAAAAVVVVAAAAIVVSAVVSAVAVAEVVTVVASADVVVAAAEVVTVVDVAVTVAAVAASTEAAPTSPAPRPRLTKCGQLRGFQRIIMCERGLWRAVETSTQVNTPHGAVGFEKTLLQSAR